MRSKTGKLAIVALAAASLSVAAASRANGTPEQAQQTAASRPIGTIKAIAGNAVTLTTDQGTEISINVQDTTRILRVEPGQKDLSNATVIHLQDLQVGDRIMVRGQASDDGKSLAATTIIAIKHADIAAKQQQEQAEWQGGVGGLVKAVDAGNGTVTITMASLGGIKTVAIHTAKDTTVRRYAPDSVEFDKAKLSTLDEIKPGDQLRARGTKSADGNDFAAQEIVSGSFQNIAGTITSIDAAGNTLSVNDLITKKPVLVKITTESELRQLSPQMAQFIAMRLRAPQGGQTGPGGAAGARPERASAPGQAPGNASGGAARTGGRADLQQMLNRLPPAKLADLQKGEAVMIVSTQGAVAGEVTAITLLGGVEPILAAAPQGGQAMTLSPWSLSEPAGDTGNP
ncbi:MAG: DUF5666 domain-containing protein [Candidatus Acidiferrales bacterium]